MIYLILLAFSAGSQFPATVAKEFIINTAKCKLPNFPAFSKETNLTYLPLNYKKCTNRDHLTYITVVNNTAYLHLKMKDNEIYVFPRFRPQILWCCYSYVTRKGTEDEPDIGISISPCIRLTGTERLTGDIVRVQCFLNAHLVYENVYYPMTIPPSVKKKLQKLSEQNGVAPISVLFVVIDSVSRLNLARTMPKTRNFLLQNDFIEFVGYNKIGDNTFPNFNALLTGLNLEQSNRICMPTVVGKLDECPMIWYDFRRLGYVTAYGEDWTTFNTYNIEKKGFKDPPTDYYFKPYFEAAESLSVVEKDHLPYCTGPETEGERILNLARDFTSTYKNQPSFGIFWMNTFSHNRINSPGMMDEKIRDFFQDIRQNGILNSSIVILLSDHGIRFGKIRITVQGWYEERLPVNLISVPGWFKTKYPDKYRNLKNNANKLTSTYDLYMTLQEVLSISVKNYTVSPSKACSTCASLFSELPEDRSCEEAGVPKEWCTCIGKFDQNDNRISHATDAKAIQLARNEVPETVSRIISSRISSVSLDEGYYHIIFETVDNSVYQALFIIRGDPIEFVKLIQVLKTNGPYWYK